MNPLPYRSNQRASVPRRAQRGVVLIISLIMLVVLSLLATLSIRNAASSETVSGNVRTTLLATQAAEIALQHCEKWAAQLAGVAAHGLSDPVAPPTVVGTATTPNWQTLATWDGGTSANVYVIPLTLVNHDAAVPTYSRAPECMIESVSVVNSMGVPTTSSTRVITARGFGPDESGAAKTRPTGSEVWVQSTIEFN
jgi:Tfp pilus assembly protein PilX